MHSINLLPCLSQSFTLGGLKRLCKQNIGKYSREEEIWVLNTNLPTVVIPSEGIGCEIQESIKSFMVILLKPLEFFYLSMLARMKHQAHEHLSGCSKSLCIHCILGYTKDFILVN